MEKILLIDGNSIVNRAFYGVPDLTNEEGLHTNAIYGFFNIIWKVMDEEKPTHLMVAFDMKAPTFRHKKYAEYKGNRKPMPEELAQQIPVLKQILDAMNVIRIEKEGIEADDIIGTMSKIADDRGMAVTVLSGDRDLLQLASDNVLVRIPKTRNRKTVVEDYYAKDVKEKIGITPLQIIDLKGLMGDASDNIPGVYGIGEKTALKLLEKYESVENVLAHVEEVTPNRAKNAILENGDMAIISKDLATIDRNCDIGVEPEGCKIGEMFTGEAFELVKKMGIKSFYSRFDGAKVGEDIEKFELPEIIYAKTIGDVNKFIQDIKSGETVGFNVYSHTKEEMNSDSSGQMTFFSDVSPLFLVTLSNGGKAIVINVDDGMEESTAGQVKLDKKAVEEEMESLCQRDVLFSTNDLKSALGLFPLDESKKVFDTALAAYVINPVTGNYDIGDICRKYMGAGLDDIYAKDKKKSDYKMYLDGEEYLRYAAASAFANEKLVKILEEEMDKWKVKELYYNIEMPLVFVLKDMENEGIRVKREELKKYGQDLGARIDELKGEIYERAGEEFNINSPKQLGEVLFEKLKMPYGKKTKTGYSTSAEVLEKLKFEDPIIELILEYRQLTKLKSTYADGLSEYIGGDGKIRTTLNQMVTATGRLSSTEPNLQNIPIRMEIGRKIRKVFVPEEGHVFLSADYSQIELRVLAHMSGDERLIESYRKNADIHRDTAALVFGVPYEEVTSLQRRNAKAVNFGIIYGISGFGLSRDLNISRKEAEAYIQDYFHTYPKVKEFMDSCVEAAKEKGYAVSLYGRVRPIPELREKNHMRKMFGERVAMNSPIQGTAADIIKLAMIGVHKRLEAEKLQSKLILQIHDELLIDTVIDEKEKVAEILHEEMVNAAELMVPLIADVKEGDNWYDAK